MCRDQNRNKNKERNRRKKGGINDSKGMARKRGVKIGGIYVNNDLEMKIEDIRKWIEEKGKKERVLIII